MSEDINTDDLNTEENVKTLLMAAIQAYELEVGEPFSVANEALADVLFVNDQEGTFIPVLGWFNDINTGRTQFTTKWYAPEDEEIIKLLEAQKGNASE